ncbi:CHRD domain-containing protein [Euzebya rosea]|uniref:CHRD domain-containing protein n=1 Tax=Euzebya rosea TaxID=2052804 RepID=UPI001476660D|nr:CHRD domain-containing protein [Euzebya rosea]
MHRFVRSATAVMAAALLILSVLAGPASAQTTEISVFEFAYDPYDTVVEVGTTVEWTNNGTATHTVTAADGSFDRLLNPGDSFELTTEEAGQVNYFCRFHGGPGGGQNAYLTVYEEGAEPPEPQVAPSADFTSVTATDDSNVAAAIAWTSLLDGPQETVLLGRDDDFADLLAAGATGRPFLVTPTDTLDDRVAAELQRLNAQQVVVVGGTAAVSEDVVGELEAAGFTVTRVAGATRIETAVDLADRFFVAGGGFAQPPSDAPRPGAIIARAFGTEDNPTAGFADSLGAASAGANLGIPILVAGPDGLPAGVGSFLAANGIGHVAVVGGEAAVPSAVTDGLDELGVTWDRVAGASRDGTAAALMGYLDGQGARYGNVVLVDGFNDNAWAQGFGASVLGSAVLLTNGPDVPAVTQDALNDFFGSVLANGLNVRCGPGIDEAACDLVGTVLEAEYISPASLIGVLEGTNETAEGHPVANGIGGVTRTEDGTMCWIYSVVLLEDVTAAHIHRAAAGEDGDVVIPLEAPLVGEAEANGCLPDADADLVAEIFANPGEFYINVHSMEHPAGAVRDNLFPFDDFYAAELSGDQEVPDPGAMMAGGVTFLTTNDDDDMCHVTFWGGLESAPTAAHIHSGGPGEAGDVLIGLTVSPVGIGSHSDCVEDTDGDALATFRAAPADHYVNLHTAEFPGGALRGQANPQWVLP